MATQTVYFNNPADITTLQNETSTLNSTVTSMSGSVASLNSSTSTLNSTVTSMSGSVGILNSTVTSMSGSVASLNSSTSTLNSTVTSMSGSVASLNLDVSALKIDNGYGQTIDLAGQFAVRDYLNNYAYGGPLLGGDANDAAHKGAFFYGGNAKTNQEFFLATGTANAAGLTWSTGTKYNFASAGKIVTGLVCTKMIEEGIINPYAPLSTLSASLASLFTGNAIYYDTITVTPGLEAAFPADFVPGPNVSSFTATTGAYPLANVTLSDLLHMNIGLMDDFFTLPGAPMVATTSQWGNGAGSLLALSSGAASNIDKAMLVQSYKYVSTLLAAGTFAYGFAAKIFNGQTIDPATVISDAVTNAINFTKAGTIPLAYAPGAKSQQLPYLARVLPSTYDTAYILLAYVLDETLKFRSSNTVNFAAYASLKFFTPLAMANTSVVMQQSISTTNLADSSFRRSVVYGAVPFTPAGADKPFSLGDVTTYPSFGCSPSYATGAFLDLVLHGTTGAAGPNVWASEYPDDGISRVINSFYQQTGSATASPIGNSPVVCSIGDYAKLLKLIANKGVAPNGTRLLKTESWNYFISSKIGSLTGLGAWTTLLNETDERTGSAVFTMGASRVANDTSNITTYGYDETTLFFDGAMGCKFYADFFTGNWFVCGVPELLLSTGDFQLTQSALDAILALNSLPPGYIKASNIALNPTLPVHGQNFLISMIQNL
jgi:hypothetical protein